jgi:hypothetical protein
MTDELLQALRTIFVSTAALGAAFTGGYHAGPAEEFVPLKGVIYEVISTPAQQVYPQDQDADIRIRFRVFAESGDGVALIQLLMGVYDRVRPSMTGVDCSNFQRLTDPIPFPVAVKSNQQSEVWGWYVDYLFHVHRAPAAITVVSVRDNGDDTVTVTFSAAVSASDWFSGQLEIAETQDGSYVAANAPETVPGFPTKLIFSGDDFHSAIGAVPWRITSAPPTIVAPQSGTVM